MPFPTQGCVCVVDRSECSKTPKSPWYNIIVNYISAIMFQVRFVKNTLDKS